MSREFIACILGTRGHDVSNLTHLDLNDVKQWAEPVPALPATSHLRELQAHVRAYEQEIGQQYPRVHDHWGSMADALDPLIDRCPHLTSLRLALLGPCEEPEPSSRKEPLYESWARFLGSVRGTLRKFQYEQGYSSNEQVRRYDGWDVSELFHFPRPMDRLFARHILPVLLEAPWPRLEKMEIRGVGMAQYEDTRNHKLTREERESCEVEYKVLDVSYRYFNQDIEKEYTIDMRALTMPSAEDMRKKLQELVPQASILVEQEGQQDFESFTENDTGVVNHSNTIQSEVAADYGARYKVIPQIQRTIAHTPTFQHKKKQEPTSAQRACKSEGTNKSVVT